MKIDRSKINGLSIYSNSKIIVYVDVENMPDEFRLEETSWDHLVQPPTAQAGSAKTCCPGLCWDGFWISAPKTCSYPRLLHR